MILNYKGNGVLRPCVESVLSSNYDPFRVLVVNNDSKEDIKEIVDIRSDKLEIIQLNTNLGYAGGNNIGIKNSNEEIIVLLNNDTVVEPTWLCNIVSSMIALNVEFAQPKIMLFDKPNRINSTGIKVHFLGFGFLRSCYELDSNMNNLTSEVSAVHGACLAARREALLKLGLLDELFFAFNEDTDLGWRATLLGYRSIYVSNAKIYHKWGHSWGATSPSKFYYLERNRLIMILTNYSARTILVFLPSIVITELLVLLQSFLIGTFKVKIKSYADLFRVRHYLSRRRARIQNSRVVSDRQVLNNFVYSFENNINFGKRLYALNPLYNLLFSFALKFI